MTPQTINPKTLSISLNAKNAANSTLERPTLWEHPRSMINYGHFPNPTPVSEHFNQTDHSIDDVLLILLELIRIRTVTLSERYARLTSLTKL